LLAKDFYSHLTLKNLCCNGVQSIGPLAIAFIAEICLFVNIFAYLLILLLIDIIICLFACLFICLFVDIIIGKFPQLEDSERVFTVFNSSQTTFCYLSNHSKLEAPRWVPCPRIQDCRQRGREG